MLEKIKNILVDIFYFLNYKKENEILREKVKVQEIALNQAKKKLEKLKEIEHEFLISDGYDNIETISRFLSIALEKIKQKDKIVFSSDEDELENSIISIGSSLKYLIESRNNRKIINDKYKAEYANQFLKNYEYFNSSEWKKESALRYERGQQNNEQI